MLSGEQNVGRVTDGVSGTRLNKISDCFAFTVNPCVVCDNKKTQMKSVASHPSDLVIRQMIRIIIALPSMVSPA